MKKSTKWEKYFDTKGKPLHNQDKKGIIKNPGTKRLNDFLKTSDENFIDFLQKCFTWDANTRLTPDDALEHPWVSDLVKKNIPHNNYG